MTWISSLFDRIPLRWQRRRRTWPGEKSRFEYQSKLVAFDIAPGQRVLDIGSGGDPFPHATVLVDRFLETSKHRHAELVRNGKPLVISDIHRLPFSAKSFDYVYCSHLLEHVDDPLRACAELMRIGKRGFIETPTAAKDMLFAWADEMHKWHVVSIADRLCFFEYTPRQVQGIRSDAWQKVIFGRWHHALQQVFYENQDQFNVLFSWSDSFSVHVFRLDGSVACLESGKGGSRALAHS